MKRSTPLRRTGPPKRKTPLKPQNRARKSRESARAYGPKERREWLTRQPCVSCGLIGTDERPNHQHHTKGGGVGRKADADTIVPLCPTCHRLHHDGHELDVEWGSEARRTEAAWQEYMREEAN